MNNLITIVLISSSLLGCFNPQEYNKKTIEVLDYEKSYNVQEVEIFVAREDRGLNKMTFSPCNICDTWIRVMPLFIGLDSTISDISYDNIIYQYYDSHDYDTLTQLGYYPDMHFYMDTLFNHTENDSNLVTVFNKILKRKVNRYHRKQCPEYQFDGYLKYYLYKVKFLCYPGGIKSFNVPGVSANDNSYIRLQKDCRVNYIVEILSIEPVKNVINIK